MKKTVLFLLAALLALTCAILPAYASGDKEEEAADYRSVSIQGFNESLGGQKVDKDALAGSGCMLLSFYDGCAANTIITKNFEKPIDISAYDTIEFDLYLSDPSFFDISYTDSSLELTSSGTYDVEELSWRLGTIRDRIEGGPKKGWNHVVMPYSTATHNENVKFNKISFMRFFVVGVKNVKTEYTVKLDNLRASDSSKPSVSEVLKLCEPVVGMIDAITATEVTAANVETVKAQVEAAKAAFRALSEEAQELFSSEAYNKLNRLNALVTRFENAPVPETENKPAVETDAPEKGGCSSAVCSLALLPLLAAVCVKKKK